MNPPKRLGKSKKKKEDTVKDNSSILEKIRQTVKEIDKGYAIS